VLHPQRRLPQSLPPPRQMSSKRVGFAAPMVDAGGGLTTMEATTATRTLRGRTIGAIGTGAAIIGDNVWGGANNSAPFFKTFCLSGAS
jgi:hypothetical protein